MDQVSITILSLSATSNGDISVAFELAPRPNAEQSLPQASAPTPCQRLSLVISANAFLELGVEKGECSQEVFEAIEQESRIYEAYRKGLYILGFGGCSRRRLISKLLAKGYSHSEVIKGVERIYAAGLADDMAGAVREAEKNLAKLWGESRIRADLLSKGFEREVVEHVMFDLEDNETDYTELCRKRLEKTYSTLPTERQEVARLISSMMRYGFTVEQAKSAYSTLAEQRKKRKYFFGY